MMVKFGSLFKRLNADDVCLARWHISIFLWIDLTYSSGKDPIEMERQNL